VPAPIYGISGPQFDIPVGTKCSHFLAGDLGLDFETWEKSKDFAPTDLSREVGQCPEFRLPSRALGFWLDRRVLGPFPLDC
jgi:hypothetical protein